VDNFNILLKLLYKFSINLYNIIIKMMIDMMYNCSTDGCTRKSREADSICSLCKTKYSKMKRCIYKITSPNTSKIFIGITSKNLQSTLDSHLKRSKKYDEKLNETNHLNVGCAYEVIRFGQPSIDLIELVEGNKMDATERLRHWINNSPDCCNKLKISVKSKLDSIPMNVQEPIPILVSKKCMYDGCKMSTKKDYCGHHTHKCGNQSCNLRGRNEFCGVHSEKTIIYKKNYYKEYHKQKKNILNI